MSWPPQLRIQPIDVTNMTSLNAHINIYIYIHTYIHIHIHIYSKHRNRRNRKKRARSHVLLFGNLWAHTSPGACKLRNNTRALAHVLPFGPPGYNIMKNIKIKASTPNYTRARAHVSCVVLHEPPRMCDNQIYTSLCACARCAIHAHVRISYINCVSSIKNYRVYIYIMYIYIYIYPIGPVWGLLLGSFVKDVSYELQN